MPPTVGQFKDIFFDSPKVKRAVDRALRRTLSRFGAFVRTRSRTSIRKSKKISAPGSPPRSHVGLLRNLILFGYEPATKSVVIGPALLRKLPGKTIPETLEYGGRLIMRGKGPAKYGNYIARPYMRPARDAELPKFLDSLKDSVKG